MLMALAMFVSLIIIVGILDLLVITIATVKLSNDKCKLERVDLLEVEEWK